VNILKINNIYKKYKNSSSLAVKNLSILVKKGELFCIVGESGSGKTTILRLIAGFEKPSGGVIQINNNIVVNKNTFISPDQRKIGMVFQNYALFPHLTVEENISFGLYKLNNKIKKQKVSEVLKLVGLVGFEKRYPEELSGGQQQRTALARAIAPSPSLILLDEPFSNLDNELKDQIREEVREILKKSNITAIIVTHDTKDALSISDNIAILKSGVLQQIGSPREIYQNPINKYVAQFFGKVNYIKAIAVKNGFLSELGFVYSTQSNFFKKKEIILNIRPEDIQICKNNESKCRGCIKSIIYWGNCQILKISTLIHTIEIFTSCDSKIKTGDMVFIKIKELKYIINSL